MILSLLKSKTLADGIGFLDDPRSDMLSQRCSVYLGTQCGIIHYPILLQKVGNFFIELRFHQMQQIFFGWARPLIHQLVEVNQVVVEGLDAGDELLDPLGGRVDDGFHQGSVLVHGLHSVRLWKVDSIPLLEKGGQEVLFLDLLLQDIVGKVFLGHKFKLDYK